MSWTVKPPPFTPVDTENPLANGLVAAFACAEGAGEVYDALTSYPLTPTGGATWTPSVRGQAPTTNASGARFERTSPAPWRIQVPMTIVWRGSYLGTPDTNGATCGLAANNSDSAPYGVAFYYVPASGQITLLYATGGASFAILSTGISAASRGPTWLAATLVTQSEAVYVDDPWTAKATDTTAIFPFTLDATAITFLGGYTGTPSRVSATNHDHFFVWNRVLKNVELAAVKANPWQLFATPSRLWMFGEPSAGGGVVGPVLFHSHYVNQGWR